MLSQRFLASLCWMRHNIGFMRTSARKTTAAVLRDIIGIKVPEWAEKLECSPHSIHDLESGRLKLSGAMAVKMCTQSGIALRWLIDGNPAAPAIAEDGREYTPAIYDEVQASEKDFAIVDDVTLSGAAFEFFRLIYAMLINANRKRKFNLASYQTAKAIVELQSKYGVAKDFNFEKALANVYKQSGFEFKRILKPKSKRPSKKRRR